MADGPRATTGISQPKSCMTLGPNKVFFFLFFHFVGGYFLNHYAVLFRFLVLWNPRWWQISTAMLLLRPEQILVNHGWEDGMTKGKCRVVVHLATNDIPIKSLFFTNNCYSLRQRLQIKHTLCIKPNSIRRCHLIKLLRSTYC